MPRRPRFVAPGLPHHITQRGNNRQNVFFCEQDRLDYLVMLGDHAARHDCRILGWCLMTNHIHLVAIPGHERSLALTLGQTHSQYSLSLNRRRNWIGHLWQNRFFSSVLATTHVLTALRYVDLNPARAGILAQSQSSAFRWSSARAHTSRNASDPLLHPTWSDWIEEARLGAWDHAAWNLSLATGQEADDIHQIRRATQVGEPLGPQEFVANLEQQAGRRLRVLAPGNPALLAKASKKRSLTQSAA